MNFSWSFGVLMWEVFTLGGSPYPSVPVQDLFELLKQGHRMQQPHSCPDIVYHLMLACWNDPPTLRPSFTQIVQFLEEILELTVPDNMVRFSFFFRFGLKKNLCGAKIGHVTFSCP